MWSMETTKTTARRFHFDTCSQMSFTIKARAAKSWTFSHRYAGWEFFTTAQGTPVCVWVGR